MDVDEDMSLEKDFNPWADSSGAPSQHDEMQASARTSSSTQSYARQQPSSSLDPPKAPEVLPNMHQLLQDLVMSSSLSTATHAYQRKALRRAFRGPLDRVNVLGDDEEYGHTGCVNALSWALDGDILISGSDDTTLRLWKLDPNDTSTSYPYKQSAIIHTGHSGNIFNALLLPSSSRIASVAGDRQVRIFDVERALTTSGQGREIDFSESETCIRVLKCHSRRTKRVVTEESSDVFLTVAEDGTVRQHDLRAPHVCSREHERCPSPLVKLPHDLSTLALSPLAPYLFVVAGEAPFAYLFDRRQVGRTLQEEWGVPCNDTEYVTCVRRFGRAQRGPGGQGTDHITGARMAQTNGHEVLLSYSADAIYLYSTRDQPQEFGSRSPSTLPANVKRHKLFSGDIDSSPDENSSSDEEEVSSNSESVSESLHLGSEGRLMTYIAVDAPEEEEQEDEDEEDDSNDIGVSQPELDEKFRSPAILPRRKFTGHCNVQTVKDVNFIGAEDEFVASGSDDGNFFLWDKHTGRLHGIYEGDGTVVNVIESHPRLPLIACSGIDKTVKLFAPTEKHAAFSRTFNAEHIIKNNMASARRSASQMGFASLFMQYRLALRRLADDESEEGEPQCTTQ